MSWLGLVLDFILPLPPGAHGVIRVEPKWKSAAYNEDLTPFTHYRYTGDQFLADWTDNSDLRDGFLDLEAASDDFENSKSPYSLVKVDPDGAVLKLLHFSGSLRNLAFGGPPFGMDPETPLPALRTGGLGLAREGRAWQLHQRLGMISQRNQSLLANNPNKVVNPPGKDFFWAEDLLRGYRVDVEDQTDPKAVQQLSLCFQKGHYLFSSGDPVVLDPEEGYIKNASTTSQEEKPDELYLHEMLFRWNGWSLCVQRPNQTIVPTTDKQIDPNTGNQVDIQHEDIDRVRSQPKGPVDLEPVLEAVPKTLPRLRYGHTYRLRVRAVDVAGNSLPAEHPDWAKASQPTRYVRFEPVPSPALVLRGELTPGEGIERMVIRSNFDTPAATDNQRHVAPPKTSQEMAETHGMFDLYIGFGANHQPGYNIALRESGTLADKEIVNILTGQSEPLPDAAMITVSQVPGDGPGGMVDQTVIHAEDVLIVPYLPDPLAAGLALQDIPRLDSTWLPGLEKVLDPNLNLKVVKVPFNLKWPDARSLRLRLAERSGNMVGSNCNETFINDETSQARWDPDPKNRVLSIYLAKAEKVTLRYSCYPGAEGENQLAIWEWLKNLPASATLKKYFLAGCLWMTTPHRKLELVHAVQQPLCEPTLDPATETTKNEMGQTAVTFKGSAILNAWSTEKFDLLADWQDWDDASSDKPLRVAKKAHASEGVIAYEEPNQVALDQEPHAPRHEFGDTLHRWVNYKLVGTSRYREYFLPQPGSPALDFTRTGPPRKLSVPNSSRPAAPRVVYILPTFGWKTHKQGNTLTRSRLGGGLRVYLERPWYSSGDDELLGVVLAQQPPDQIQDSYPYFLPYITQYGLDPIWKSALPHVALDHTDFTNFAAIGDDLTLDELAQMPGSKPKRVNVVGYTPEFNEERQLWFCDIQFNPDRLSSYYPFVRLALARFQPYSIPQSDAFLSRVVMTDFIQLAPTRILRVAIGPDKRTIDLTLTGFAPNYTGGNRVEVTVQKHDDNIPGDLGWKPIDLSKMETNPVWLSGHPVSDNSFLWVWHGSVLLPKKHPAGRFRLVVKEYEILTADGPVVHQVSGAEEMIISDVKGMRVVYADIVEI